MDQASPPDRLFGASMVGPSTTCIRSLEITERFSAGSTMAAGFVGLEFAELEAFVPSWRRPILSSEFNAIFMRSEAGNPRARPAFSGHRIPHTLVVNDCMAGTARMTLLIFSKVGAISTGSRKLSSRHVFCKRSIAFAWDNCVSKPVKFRRALSRSRLIELLVSVRFQF